MIPKCKQKNIETGTMQYNSNITNVDHNNWIKEGNIVQVSFRGLVSSNIANSSTLLTLPFPSVKSGTPFTYIGGRYNPSTNVFTWLMEKSNKLDCGPITAENYVHIFFTYICED